MESLPALEKDVGDGSYSGKKDKLKAEYGKCTEAELVSAHGSSSTEVVKDFPLQTGRYVISFPESFSSCWTSSSLDCY